MKPIALRSLASLMTLGAVGLSLVGCSKSGEKAAPSASAAATSASAAMASAVASAMAVASSIPTSAASTAPSVPTGTVAAPTFPSRDLCGKYTVAAPPDAKLEATCFITSDAYRLGVKPGKPGSLQKLKGIFAKSKGFNGYLVDDEHGFVLQTKSEFIVMFSAEVGGKLTTCDSTLTKPPKTEEKAREAFAVCKSLAAK